MNEIIIDGHEYEFQGSLEDLLKKASDESIVKPCYVPGSFDWQKWPPWQD